MWKPVNNKKLASSDNVAGHTLAKNDVTETVSSAMEHWKQPSKHWHTGGGGVIKVTAIGSRKEELMN